MLHVAPPRSSHQPNWCTVNSHAKFMRRGHIGLFPRSESCVLDIREFVARMWVQEDKVSEKLRLQRDSPHNAKRRAMDLRLQVGAKVWLSSKGITIDRVMRMLLGFAKKFLVKTRKQGSPKVSNPSNGRYMVIPKVRPVSWGSVRE